MAAALHLSGVKTPIQFMLNSKSSFCYPSIHIRRQQHHLGVFQLPRLPVHSSSLRLRCEAVNLVVMPWQNSDLTPNGHELDCVIMYGTSIDSADRMREVAEYVRKLDGYFRSLEIFVKKRPVIFLSAMGETTYNKLRLAAEKAVSLGVKVTDIEEFTFIKDFHLRTADELGLDREIISKHLSELEQILKLFATFKMMYPWQKDYVVSFGERMSTTIFTAYLNKIGVNARESMKPVKEGDNHAPILSCDDVISEPAPMPNCYDGSTHTPAPKAHSYVWVIHPQFMKPADDPVASEELFTWNNAILKIKSFLSSFF